MSGKGSYLSGIFFLKISQVPVTWKVNVTKIQSWEGIEPRPSLNVVERATTPHPRIKLLILIFNKYLI